MIRKIREAQEREEGFTLIELLVVVIIIGILAAIAIPSFLSQRDAARTAAAESDLRNMATAFETYYTQTQVYPDTITVSGNVATLSVASGTPALTHTTNVSANVTLTPSTAAAGTFCLTGNHTQVGAAGSVEGIYDSDGGGLRMGVTACP